MTISEKIMAYFDDLVAKGKLKPGDKLPKYQDIEKMFQIPYASVQRAFKAMEHAGKIKVINGVGSFLNGGDSLDVDFYVTATTFPLSELQKIVDEISLKNDLHLNIVVKDKNIDFNSNVTDHKVVIAASDQWRQQSGCLLDYSTFPDFQDFISRFEIFGDTGNSNLQLPFFRLTYQGIVNRRLLKQIGMEISEISNLDFWNEAEKRCRKHGIIPAALTFIDNAIWNFPIFDLVSILALQQRTPGELFNFPLFTTNLGKRIFEIADSCKNSNASEIDFIEGNTLLNFSIGSWFAAQNARRFHMPDSDWMIVPFRAAGKQAMYYNEVFLKTFANPTITKNERERIWCFLKEFLSKKNQKKITGFSGIISARRDMKISDYPWCTRSDLRCFIPTKSTVLFSEEVLSHEKRAMLAVLYAHRKIFNEEKLLFAMDSVLCKNVFESKK
jgi:DNA-binding transcriptional regulator YhcF (GntR family)